MTPPLPLGPRGLVTTLLASATLLSACAPPAAAPPPPKEPLPAPATEQVIAPERPPATTAVSPSVRPRTPANDQLYLGG